MPPSPNEELTRNAHDRLLAIGDVVEHLAVGRSTLYRWIRDGRFPKALELSPQVHRWRASEVEQWIRTLNAVDPTARR